MYKENIEELANRNRNLDPFYNEIDSAKMFREIKNETQEAIEEYEKWDYKELEAELWDIYWDFLLLTQKLEDEGKIKIENIYEKICDKITRRKTFLVKNKEVTKEEAVEIWNNAKRKEWYEEHRLWNQQRDEN